MGESDDGHASAGSRKARAGAPVEVPADIFERVRALCLALPEVTVRVDEPRIASRSTAHSFDIRRRSFCLLVATAGPTGRAVPRLVLRADPDERRALLSIGRPYVVSRAGRDRIGVLLTEGTDWDEIHGLVVDSYRILAPAKLTALLDQHAPTVGPAVSSTPATRADPVGETGATAGPSDAP